MKALQILVLTICIIYRVEFSYAHPKVAIAVDENWICNVKRTCESCLGLPQCSWCPTENKCFSKKLTEDFCKDNSIDHEDLGLSLEDNANCICRGDKFVNATTCYPPRDEGDAIPLDEAICSGRGKCVCGRCLCNPSPDPESPTKVVIGDYCEFDNFSCQDECNEGPYLLDTYLTKKEDVDDLEEI